jgi:hypothetical protein
VTAHLGREVSNCRIQRREGAPWLGLEHDGGAIGASSFWQKGLDFPLPLERQCCHPDDVKVAKSFALGRVGHPALRNAFLNGCVG